MLVSEFAQTVLDLFGIAHFDARVELSFAEVEDGQDYGSRDVSRVSQMLEFKGVFVAANGLILTAS